jgi:hypothetical protein
MMKAMLFTSVLILSSFASAANKPCIIEWQQDGAQTVTIETTWTPVTHEHADIASWEYHEVIGNYFVKIIEADGWYFFNANSDSKKMSVGPESSISVELADPGSLIKVNCPEQY